jgi:hypothetical protein
MKRFVIYSIGVLLVAFGLAAASNLNNFGAHLSGGNEVPSVATNAQGQVTFHVRPDGLSIDYKLIAADIENVRASHIHLAAEGVNGPVIVFLFGGPTIQGPFNGVLAEGTITAANLIGPMAGQTISDLLAQLEAGNLYVNVHTDANPGGEIRGQLK